MESLTRLVSESLTRHGFDRPLDYRRLSWSRWFRCESHHSLLVVPSKPGVFALAEEIMDLNTATAHVKAGDSPAQQTLSEAQGSAPVSTPEAESREPEAGKRMLAVTQFFEDDDMAFVLDRMLSRNNPMAAPLASGRYFVRFVVIQDQTQRRSICAALNQWIASDAEKATGIGSHFASSLELTPSTEHLPQPEVVWDRVSDPIMPSVARLDFASATDTNVARAPSPASADTTNTHVGTDAFVRPASEASGPRSGPGFSRSHSPTAPQRDSGAATNIHCPTPFPAGF